MDTPVEAKDQDLNSFHSLMLRLQGGAINDLMTKAVAKAVQEVADACADRGGKHKATVTLSLEFTMDQKDRTVEIHPKVDEKHPKVPLGRAGIYFVGSGGRLLRESPRQLTIEDEFERKRQERESAQA